MKKIYGIPFGRQTETIAQLDQPELWAKRSGLSWDSPYTFQKWPNRQSLAKSIRMQQNRASRQDDWKAIVPLTLGEGY